MIHSDLKFDGTRCENCKRLLCKHIASKRIRRGLCEYDNDIVFSTMVDIICASCGAVNSIFWAADMLPALSMEPRHRRFGCAPTV